MQTAETTHRAIRKEYSASSYIKINTSIFKYVETIVNLEL